MTRELRCADLFSACPFVAQGRNDDEVMQKAVEHAKEEHGVATILPEVKQKARAAIRDSGPLKDAQGKPFILGEGKLS